MCTISINPASVVALSLGTGTASPIQISVSGTIANCSSNSVTVEVACQGLGPSKANAVVSGNNWTATVQSKCSCGTPLTIIATCHDTPPCTDTYPTTPICNCCPTINIDPPCIEYNSSGKALVKFKTTVTVPSGCSPVTVQWDFGDGGLGSPQIFSSTSTTPDYSEIHAYNTSSVGHIYTATLNILSRPSCTPRQIPINISMPPKCATNSLLALLCVLAQFFFLLFGSVGVILFLASLLGCGAQITPPGTVKAIAAAFVGQALLALLFLWLACKKCICMLLMKLLGQLLLIIGVLLSMFIIQPTCLQLASTAAWALFYIIFVTAGVLVIGFVVLYVGWFLSCCPLTICDFWQAVIFAMIVAFVAALFVYFTLLGGVQALGVGLAVLIASLIMNFAAIQITINQNAHNC